jgi:hypothetical protein
MRIRCRALSLSAILVVAVATGLAAFAQGRGSPGFTPTNWKPGNKVTSKGGEVQVIVQSLGPPVWDYSIAGQNCPTCGSPRFPSTIEEVVIVSDFVPVECGNRIKKMISSTTAGWKAVGEGESFVGPKGGTKQMGLQINCDAKDGSIYLQVKWSQGTVSGTATVGPLPGPVDPQ